ncbi:alpha-ketoglutarate decarboxylase [Flavobacteriales bacterium 34_180_T64]|nr:alpha-ketoglutarate decarboxylase [Flavobacteriales bacterium 34_180_T64]
MKFIKIFDKNITCLIIVFFLILTSITAQEKNNKFWENVRFGGGIGLSFGDGFFSGTLAPSAIYDFNTQFALGLGLNGAYNERKDFYNSTIIGASIIGLFNPIPEIQLSTEFEELNVHRNWENDLGIENEHYWYPALFMGLGYQSRNVIVGIRYDLLYDKTKSIYADPWAPFFRVYF